MIEDFIPENCRHYISFLAALGTGIAVDTLWILVCYFLPPLQGTPLIAGVFLVSFVAAIFSVGGVRGTLPPWTVWLRLVWGASVSQNCASLGLAIARFLPHPLGLGILSIAGIGTVVGIFGSFLGILRLPPRQ